MALLQRDIAQMVLSRCSPLVFLRARRVCRTWWIVSEACTNMWVTLARNNPAPCNMMTMSTRDQLFLFGARRMARAKAIVAIVSWNNLSIEEDRIDQARKRLAPIAYRYRRLLAIAQKADGELDELEERLQKRKKMDISKVIYQ